ncbi:MAG TPA: hypothetical protein VKD72_26640, partial [Gemmataceae bacterium]|nr:hypothetical protein [Gemmataceae bacterium]
DVMVEGKADPVTDRAILEQLAAVWATKWNGEWQFDVVDGGFASPDPNVDRPVLVFAVEPVKVFAFGKGEFSQTRYQPQ